MLDELQQMGLLGALLASASNFQNGKWDLGNNVGTGSDTFVVNGMTMNAQEFTNYSAGYVNQGRFGGAGAGAASLGGEANAAGEAALGGEDWYKEGYDQVLIRQGAADAQAANMCSCKLPMPFP